MGTHFTEVEFLERKLLKSRLGILDYKWEQVANDQQEQYPDREFTLAEVQDMGSLINTLRSVDRVYGER
jgi:hypothetical protein